MTKARNFVPALLIQVAVSMFGPSIGYFILEADQAIIPLGAQNTSHLTTKYASYNFAIAGEMDLSVRKVARWMSVF